MSSILAQSERLTFIYFMWTFSISSGGWEGNHHPVKAQFLYPPHSTFVVPTQKLGKGEKRLSKRTLKQRTFVKAVWKKIRKTNDLRSKHVWNGLDTGYWMILPRVCHQRKSRQSEWSVIWCFSCACRWQPLFKFEMFFLLCVGLAKF